MEELNTFLLRYPPFASLDPGVVRALANEAEELTFSAGETVLVADGLPAAGLYMIRSGSMDVIDDGVPILALGVGECFGHPSFLTGMAPTFSVRARADSVCLRFSPDASRRVLGTQAGSVYVAASLRDRLTHADQTFRGLHDLGTTPVGAVARPAVFCDPDMSLRDAAATLDRDGASELLMRVSGGGLGIVSRADVRAHLAGGDGERDTPVRALARAPVMTVPAAQLAIDATVDMLTAETEYLAVAEGERVWGVLSPADLLGLEARSPAALRHQILGAADEAGLVRAVSDLSRLFGLLVDAGVPAGALGRVLTLQHDAIVSRFIDFSMQRHGPAPLGWAWLDLGSAARREFTLSSDQDNALAYEQPPAGGEAEVDAYFGRLGEDVTGGLERCGIAIDNNGVLAANRLWRMAKPAWVQTFRDCLRNPAESQLIRATVGFDFRSAAGGLAISADLAAQIRTARDHPQFMGLVARAAAGFPVALNFRGHLAPGHDGAPAGRLDIKRGGIIPLVNLVRYHALATGVTISPTLDRIEAVTEAGGLAGEDAEALQEAFAVITRVRFEHHAKLVSAGRRPDNLIDPGELAPIARNELRAALQAIRRAQRRLPA